MIKQAYINGFMRKCAERGIDGRKLLQKQGRDWSWITDSIKNLGKRIRDWDVKRTQRWKDSGAMAAEEAKDLSRTHAGSRMVPGTRDAGLEHTAVGYDILGQGERSYGAHGRWKPIMSPTYSYGRNWDSGSTVTPAFDVKGTFMDKVWGPVTDEYRAAVESAVKARKTPLAEPAMQRALEAFENARNASRYAPAGWFGYPRTSDDLSLFDRVNPYSIFGPTPNIETDEILGDILQRINRADTGH